MEKDVNRPAEDSLLVVSQCVENLEKLVNLKSSADRTLYVASIERLQLAVCAEVAAMRHFTSGYCGGIPLLVTILEKNQDQIIRYSAIAIIEKMLLQNPGSEYAQMFVDLGMVDHLLKLIVKCQLSWGEDFVSSLYRVTAKIAEEDKKFAVKARFLGVLPIIVSHLRTYSKRCKVLNAILRLLKKTMTSSVNSTKLSKDGLPRELLHFLDEHRKNITIPVLSAIAEATRTRHAARQFVKEDLIPRVLNIIFTTPCSESNKVSSVICKICLRILVHSSQIKLGREKLLAASTVPALLSWCQSILDIPGARFGSLVSLVSTVVQRCLPPRTLPVRKLNSALTFVVSGGPIFNESDSSDGPNDDTLSLASSKLSSADSGSDSDEQELKTLDVIESRFDELMDHFSSFFVEMNDPLNAANSLPSDPDDPPKSVTPVEDPRTQRGVNNSLIPKMVPRQSPILRRDTLHRKQRRDKHSRSNSLTCIPLYSDTSLKIVRRSDPSYETLENIPTRNPPHYAGDVTASNLYSSVHGSLAASTVSVGSFVKLAYPDHVDCDICDDDVGTEPLLDPDPFLVRHKMYLHAEQMSQNDQFYTEIYNFDTLLSESNYGTLGNRDHERIYSDALNDHLQFEARFESGNLRKVFWRGGYEYDLILNPDINSKSHVQWFYFEVSGMQAAKPYVFNIINMQKSTSQFNEGVCPVVFSVRNHLELGESWRRAGTDICYFRNHYTAQNSKISFHTLTFTLTFQHSNDVCYVAYHYPYTYTTLQTHLHFHFKNYDSSAVYLKKDELCKTLSRNSVPLLTITAKPLNPNRPYVFLTARVHPGESNSSWVMKGSLDYLLSNKAQRLREEFIFKVVPMLNPDGVINGCHRCSLSGLDLNRQWITPNVHLHPTIYYTKSLLQYLASKNKKPLAFCDYHGHSRRSNAFFFGCNPEQSWWPADENKTDCESFKTLPLLMVDLAPTFSLSKCQFTVERNRESTGRVTVWRQFDVPLSYTLECSYGGCNEGKYAGCHMGLPHLQDTGMRLCECFGRLKFDYCSGKVWGSTLLDANSIPTASFVKSPKTKPCASSTSTSTDEELEDYEDEDLMT